MKVYCSKSGVTFNVNFDSSEKQNQSCFHPKQIDGEHPIFSAPISFLLGRYKDWQLGIAGDKQKRLNGNEARLLFIALLNATELVDFRVPARPSAPVVYKNMDQLAKFVGWLHLTARPEIIFGKYVISSTTADCEHIKFAIQEWWKTIDSWKDGYKAQLHQHKLQAIEDRLEKYIRGPLPTEDSPQFTRRLTQLANWAMVAARVPQDRRTEWSQIITTKPSSLDVYKLDVLEVKDMIDYMHDNLAGYAGGIYSHAFFTHMRELELKVASGLQGFVGEELDEEAINGISFRIVDEVEEHNIAQITAEAPEDEPKASEYSSRYLYLRAKAAWDLAQAARERLEGERAIEAAKLAAAEKDESLNIVTEEELTDDSGEIIEEILRGNSGNGASHDDE